MELNMQELNMQELNMQELLNIEGGGIGDYVSIVGGAAGIGFSFGGPIGAAIGGAAGAGIYGISFIYDKKLYKFK